MGLRCLWHQRTLSRQVVLGEAPAAGSPLAAHLAQCAACRQFRDGLRVLTSDLPRALPAPDASPAFLTALELRLAQESPSPPARLSPARPLLALGGVSLVAMLLWNLLRSPVTPHQPPAITAVKTTKEKSASGPLSRIAKAAKPPISPAAKRAPQRQDGPQPSRLASIDGSKSLRQTFWRLRRRTGLKKSAMRLARTEKKSAVSVETATMRAQRWAAWGIWWETNGAYQQAASAYEAAARETNTPDLSFAAGRAAEAAGDTVRALLHYHALLYQQPGGTNAPEKDTRQWLENYPSL